MNWGNTKLAEEMIAKADADGLPDDHQLRTKALDFNEAIQGYFSDPQTCDIRKFIGCWARARRAWCDYTGEALV